MRNVHIIPNGIYGKKFIQRINDEFGADENYFLVHTMPDEKAIEGIDNVEMIGKNQNLFKMFSKLTKYDKIFLHNISYISAGLMLLLALVPKRKIKQYWVLWGMDLYYYQKEKSLKEKIFEFARRVFIQNLYGIIFWVEGDYNLACKWYRTKAKYFKGGYGEDNSDFLRELKDSALPKTDKNIKIQVGNSASTRNNHIAALQKLKQFDNSNMIVYSPLSYAGNSKYIEEVITEGKSLFGDRFIPLTELIPKDKYWEHLNSIDIGIFNTDRQMGLGNITTLVALGKKVYINDFTTSWDYYRERGIEIFSFNALDPEKDKETFFTPLSEKVKESNFNKVVELKLKFNEYWGKIFES